MVIVLDIMELQQVPDRCFELVIVIKRVFVLNVDRDSVNVEPVFWSVSHMEDIFELWVLGQVNEDSTEEVSTELAASA